MHLERVLISMLWSTLLEAVSGNPCFFWESSVYLNGHCYKLGSLAVSWDDAQKSCGKAVSQGRLAEPRSDTSLTFLTSAVTLSGENWWIGGVIVSSGLAKTPRWSSSLMTIESGNVSISESGTCIQLTDSKKELLVPVMASNQCSAKQHFVCELYVGDPCDAVFAGGEYFTDRNCYRVANTLMHWDEAVTTCAEHGSKLAEFYSDDPYYYFRRKLEKLGGRQVFIPANSTLYLEDYGITMSAERGYFPFRIRTCGHLKVIVWSETSTTSANSHSRIGGGAKNYYVIDYGIANTSSSAFQYCNASTCRNLTSKTGVAFNCSKFVDIFLSWSQESNWLYVSGADIGVNFNVSKMTMLPLNRMAIKMGNGNAVWMFEDPLYSADIFLGGGDTLREGVFTWLSTDRNVSIGDWRPGEPNDWPEGGGEDHLGWRFVGYTYALNDVNGTDKVGRPFCQKEFPAVTYLIVLPEIDQSEYKTPEVHVTSGRDEVVYLHYTQRMNNGETTKITDWVTSYRGSVFNIDSNLEMRDTGVHHGVVVLKSTDHVTVVLHQISIGQVSTTLVFPVDRFSSGYFILTNASKESGSHMSVTALKNNTDVEIKLPRDIQEPLTITVHGFSFLHCSVAKITLDQFDTVHMQSTGDFSGSFVYAAKPVAVYSGSKSVQTNGQTSGSTLDMALPVDSLTHDYVTFPSLTSSATSVETFRVLALYDDTDITIFGSPVTNKILTKAGHFTDITLPTSKFHHVTSDSYHPFYVTKMTSSTAGACVTSLLPVTLWRNQYDVDIRYEQETIAIVLERALLLSLVLDGEFDRIDSCSQVEGTTLVGCTLQLGHGLHHIGFNDTRSRFAAYGSQTLTNGMGYCHALGASDGRNKSHQNSTNKVLFPSLKYTHLQESQTFTPPNFPEATTTEFLTTEDLDTTEGTETTTFEQTTSAVLEQTTTENLSEGATNDSKYVTSLSLDTTPVQAASHHMQTTTLTPTTNQEVGHPPTTAGLNTTRCLHTKVPEFNLSKQEVDKITMEIVRLITINIRDTLAYKRTKMCAWEDRLSCHVIGISGSLIALAFLSFLILSDVCRLLGFVLAREDTKVYGKDGGGGCGETLSPRR